MTGDELPPLQPDLELIEAARIAALASGCRMSKRGAVIFRRHGGLYTAGIVAGLGANHQPGPHACDGSPACESACGQLCVHAEVAAIRNAPGPLVFGAILIHVKVVDDKIVATGAPSCWQCSREILDVGIAGVWLYETTPHDPRLPPTVDPFWKYYSAREFHVQTLKHDRNRLPVIY